MKARLFPRVGAIVVACPLFVGLISTGNLRADESPATLRLLDGTAVTGRHVAWNNDTFTVHNGDGDVTVIPTNRVLRLAYSRRVWRSRTSPMVQLVNGDRLVGTPGAADDIQWNVIRQNGDRLSVPLEWIDTALFSFPAALTAQAELRRRLDTRSGGSDTAFLVNGDVLTGRFETAGGGRVIFETEVARGDLQTASMRAVALDRELALRPELPGEYALVRLTDGSWFHAGAPTSSDASAIDDEGNMMFQTLFGVSLSVPIEELVDVQFFNSQVRALQLPDAEHVMIAPQFGPPSEPLENRNARGGFLRTDNEEFAFGIGVASGTSITWKLPDGASRISVTAMRDSLVGKQGRAVAAVEVDGQRREEAVLHSGHAVQEFSISLPADAARVSLVLEPGIDADFADLVNWIAPSVIREPR